MYLYCDQCVVYLILYQVQTDFLVFNFYSSVFEFTFVVIFVDMLQYNNKMPCVCLFSVHFVHSLNHWYKHKTHKPSS